MHHVSYEVPTGLAGLGLASGALCVAILPVVAELETLDKQHIVKIDKLDIVGVYPNYAAAYAAWKGKAQRTVDNALMRYFIVHMHRLLDPATDATRQKS